MKAAPLTINTYNHNGMGTNMPPPKKKQGIGGETSSCRSSSRIDSSCSSDNSSSRSRATKSAEEKLFGAGRAIWIGRLLFSLCLVAVAVTLGLLAQHFLSKYERELAEKQFESIASRAIALAEENTLNKGLGASQMAQIASYANPRAKDWPNVFIPAFETIAKQLMDSYSTKEYAFMPRVEPGGAEQQAFENFAYEYFYEIRQPPFENGTGKAENPHVEGIFGQWDVLNTTHNRFHDTTGLPVWWESDVPLMFPILQQDKGPFFLLMFNAALNQMRGLLLRQMLECTEIRKWRQDLEMDCTAISPPTLWKRSSLVFHPVYPAMDPFEFTGSIQTRISWISIVEQIFHEQENAKSIDCVLQFDDTIYSYHVVDGIANFTGEGDFHDPAYTHLGVSGVLASQITTTAGESSQSSYIFTLYPNEDFFDEYRTPSPAIAAWGAVAIVVFTSMIFFVYDFFVRREFEAKRHMLQAKRKFVRFISHEVRTPLNAVMMGLTLLRDELSDGAAKLCKPLQKSNEVQTMKDGGTACLAENAHMAEIKKWEGLAGDIMDNTQSAVDVLNDLLNYDRIQMGTFSLELSILPIWSLVASCCREFRLQAEKKGVDLRLDFSALEHGNSLEQAISEKVPQNVNLSREMHARKVVGDHIRICQVVRNLLSNGLKFTRDGGSLTVRASWLKPSTLSLSNRETESQFTLEDGQEVSFMKSGYAQFEVIDTGIGMSQDQLAKLFKDGVQFNVNDLQAGQGSGLGLFISLGLVQQHGGTLEVSSEGIGYGTTFTLQLPLCYVPEVNDVATSENAKEGVIALNKNESIRILPLRILVVDDVAMNRRMLTRLCERAGHHVTESVDGKDALKKVEEAISEGRPFDSVLLDYEMPVLNGPDSARGMRKVGCDSFIVGITGNVMKEDTDKFMSYGADAVMPKPLNFNDLQSIWIENGITGEGSDEAV